jgi:hypothetical protein
MQIIPFDPGSESHTAFVFDAVRKRAYDWPWTPGDMNYLIDLARRAIMKNPRGCVMAVAPSDPDLFYGYVLSEPGIVTMAYTKDALRGPGAFDSPVGTPPAHAPVCSTLLDHVGIDPSGAIQVRIWSRAASKIAMRGYRLVPMAPE